MRTNMHSLSHLCLCIYLHRWQAEEYLCTHKKCTYVFASVCILECNYVLVCAYHDFTGYVCLYCSVGIDSDDDYGDIPNSKPPNPTAMNFTNIHKPSKPKTLDPISTVLKPVSPIL